MRTVNMNIAKSVLYIQDLASEKEDVAGTG